MLVNPENAQSFWRPDYKGMDWADYTNMGKEISEMFLGFFWGGFLVFFFGFPFSPMNPWVQ